MGSTLKQILRNICANWLAVLIQAAIAFFLIPFLLKTIGKDGYGFVGLLGVILGFSQVADLGLRNALGRELTEFLARKDNEGYNELVTSALSLYVGIGSLLALSGWFLAPWFVEVFKIPSYLSEVAVSLCRLYITVALIFSFITPVFNAVLSSHERFDLIHTIQIFCSIFSGTCLFLFLPRISSPLHGWVVIMLVNQFMMLIAAAFFAARSSEGIRIRFRYVSSRRIKPLFQLGGYMYALQLTQVLSAQTDPLVISFFLGPAGVALYNPGQRLSSIARPIVTSLSNQLYPLTTRHHVGQQVDQMQQVLTVGTKFTLLLGVLACVLMVSCAEPLCRLWLSDSLGEEYLMVSLVLAGWAIADLLAYSAGTQWPVLLGIKRLGFLVWTQLPTAILNVIISIYLVGFTNMGIMGVLVATIIIGIIRRPILIAYTARVCQISALKYFKEGYLRAIIVLIVLGAIASFIRLYITPKSWIELIFLVTGMMLIWLALVWGVGMSRDERKQVTFSVKKVFLNFANHS